MCLQTISNMHKTMVFQKSTESPASSIQVCLLVLVCLSTLSSINAKITSSIPNKIQKGQMINVSQSIVSASGSFELGFFSPKNTTNLYVGIWLFKKRVSEYCVWIANRDYPLLSSSAILTINLEGNIVISDGKKIYMVTNTSRGKDTFAMLTDSGNLVLKESNSSEDDHGLLWQSFDYPTHSLLTGMTFMWDSSSLLSWKSEADPTPGNFSLILDSSKKQLVIKDRSNTSGGDANENEGSMLGMILNKSFQGKLYLGINPQNDSSGQISRLVLDESGQLKLQSCSAQTKLCTWIWSRCWYSLCGAYSNCNETTKSCSCLPGSKRVDNSTLGENPISCKRKIELKCSNLNLNADNFFPISTTEFPNGALKFDVGNDSGCKSACLKNCSLIVYAYDEQSGCLLWNTASFFNLRQHSNHKHRNTRKLSLRLAAGFEISHMKVISVTHETNGSVKMKKKKGIKNVHLLIILSVGSVVLLILCRLLTKQRRFGWKAGKNLLHFDVEMSLRDDHSELPELKMRKKGGEKSSKLVFFTFSSVATATDNFSDEKQIGEGGSGLVYKGTLIKGDEVAVKRQIKKSHEGKKQFKTEANLIARLRHRNLVKLLGCCIERKERILIYEYMRNKSLDFYLFDSKRGSLLTWEIRVRIIEGISQGLLYLHQYSRIRIIHGDLKANNILLDEGMNPRISDFGMARILKENQPHRASETPGGTFGYMSPEYSQGIVSDKADVFSFGVLLLEIVSGKRNATNFPNWETRSIIAYAWKLWTSDRALELMDPLLEDQSTMHVDMVLRYIHIALLCVQESTADRPNMSQVVMWLSNYHQDLSQPKQPAFFNSTTTVDPNPVQIEAEIVSTNFVTVSAIEPRP
ncbi:G-type lectin S-receptor-like serine/threonine-protein kinase At1g11300 [Humulus lupulus]|uniref:G-type lectin S-receptor-like serine/threonine-protein kinase At1g11300 n=1 Tax=Humulus lupulus TaxID=3486 RepID=UPI002B40498D|nr:G-type lectin S-receptor-like serine/threonine-protein kinase At1g11300 [Humulus lupulus]